MDNIEIAQILNEVADILDIQEANKFRAGAYRRAAQVIEAMPEDINEIYRENKLEEIPGVGESIAEKIKELIEKGKSKEIEKIKAKVPEGLSQLMEIEGLGPKRVKFLYQKFRVDSIGKLKKLIESHKLLKYKGWGEKSEANILRGIELYKRFSQRFLLGKVYFLSQDILAKLRGSAHIERVEICGSIRRRKETIGDLDILAISKKPSQAIDFFCNLPIVGQVLARGSTKANVVLRHGPEADLRVVKPESFGAAMHYFTGSKAHNIHIRRMGMEKGLRINEYGVFRKRGKKLIRIGGKTEEEVFKAVGLPWIPPEIREDEGEIEAAQTNKLPKLVKLGDIKGDLHVHTNWSDGEHSILEMAESAKKKEYEYIAITDHGSPMGIVHGLSPKRVMDQIKAVRAADKKIHGIKILTGIEVDILPDGRLYFPDKILEKLDIVVAGVHSSFRQSEKLMTARIARAIKNPNVDIIAHPTGRILNEREPYEMDMEEIIKLARETNTILEINAFWNRLDLNAVNARLAKMSKVKIAISTDAHNIMGLDIMRFGVDTARRGWLEKKDVINAWPLKKMLKWYQVPPLKEA